PAGGGRGGGGGGRGVPGGRVVPGGRAVLRCGAVDAEGVLGEVPAERGDEPDRPGPPSHAVHGLGDGVHRVVVAGTAEVRQAARDRQRAGVGGGDAEHVAPDLHGGREAAVE